MFLKSVLSSFLRSWKLSLKFLYFLDKHEVWYWQFSCLSLWQFQFVLANYLKISNFCSFCVWTSGILLRPSSGLSLISLQLKLFFPVVTFAKPKSSRNSSIGKSFLVPFNFLIFLAHCGNWKGWWSLHKWNWINCLKTVPKGVTCMTRGPYILKWFFISTKYSSWFIYLQKNSLLLYFYIFTNISLN